jgi:hypothetical protein
MNTNIKTQKGYAILFTIVLVGIISAISIGLASVSYKQLILSSVAKDSQVSFYQADTASECGLYAENKLLMTTSSQSPWSCGIDSNDSGYILDISPYSTGGYTLIPNSLSLSSSPCFNVIMDKTTSTTKLIARGYNICNKTNIRTVEREINITSAP